MEPIINFYIKGFENKTIFGLEKTIKSIANTQYVNKTISLLIKEEDAEFVSQILNRLEEKVNIHHKNFNKFPLGIPTFCLGFGNGKIKESDALNIVIQNTIENTNLYSVLTCGDEIVVNFPYLLLNYIMEQGNNIIGFLYSDYFLNNSRIYNDTYSKELLDTNKIGINNFSFPSYILNEFKPDDTEYKFLQDVSNKFMGIHIPYPLFSRSINE